MELRYARTCVKILGHIRIMKVFKILLLHCVLSFATLVSITAQDINIHGTTILNVTSSDMVGGVPITVTVPQLFPAREISHVSDTIPADGKQITLRCPVRSIQLANVSIHNKNISLLLIPGDTLSISIGSGIEVTGRTSQIQEYCEARDRRFPVPVSQLLMTAGVNARDLHAFKVQADSVYSQDMEFWKEYQRHHVLPAWFTRYESDAIRYRNAWLRCYMVTYQKFAQKKSGAMPADYFDFLKALPVRNEAAMYNDYYMRFLYDYVRYKANVGTAEFDQALEFSLAEEMLGVKIGEWYRLFSISSYLQGDPEKVKADLEKHAFAISYHDLIQYLLNRVDAANQILGPGDEAPDFFLMDQLDSLVSLSDFRGQIVYLSFWFPGCKGCIHEFPYENALVKEFEAQPVKVINICTLTTKSTWTSMVDKYGLKTLNLYANESWRKRLEGKYGIGVYPHYVLIDERGRVIENYATRPSKNASEKIEGALRNLRSR